MRPCKACCLRGKPEGCIFEVNDETRNALTQLEEIQQLRSQVAKLTERLHQKSSGPQSSSTPPATGNVNASLSVATPDRKDPWRNAGPGASRQTIQLTRSTVPFAFIQGVFLERLVDRYAPVTPGAHQWLRSVAAESYDEESSLSMAVRALSMASCAAQDHDKGLQVQAHGIYTKVLRQLQYELNSPGWSTRPEVLYATMVVSLFELLIRNNAMSWLIHLNGLSRLLQHRGPASHATGLEHETLRFFRIFGLTLCVFTRTPSFLSQPAWKTQPWAYGYPSKDIQDLLLDQVLDIPTLWCQADMLRQRIAAGNISPEAARHEQGRLQSNLASVYAGLEEWKHKWALTYPGVSEALAQQSPSHSQDGLASGHKYSSERIPLIDHTLSQSVNMYYAGKLLLLRARLDVDQLTPEKVQELVELIREGVEFSLQVVDDYFGAMRLLFPLRVAYFTAPEDSPLRPRIQQLFDILAEQFQVAFARVLVASLPGFAGQVQLSSTRTPSPPVPTTPVSLPSRRQSYAQASEHEFTYHPT